MHHIFREFLKQIVRSMSLALKKNKKKKTEKSAILLFKELHSNDL